MNPDAHIKFSSFIYLLTMILSTIHKETTYYTFTYIRILIVLVDTILLIIYIYLDSLKKSS